MPCWLSVHKVYPPALPLLNLPLELRHEIYKMSLPDEINVAMTGRTHVPLLDVSRYIRQECSTILYRTCTFLIDLTAYGHHTKLLKWIYSLNHQQVASLRHLKIKSTLKLLRSSGRIYNRKFWFDFCRKPDSPTDV